MAPADKRMSSARHTGHKGNKSALPAKPCAVCGRPMSWRKAWARTWADVRYCSDACRARKKSVQGSDG